MILGEHVTANYQHVQFNALSESIRELSLVATGYFGTLLHTDDFTCNYIKDQSLNFIKLPYNFDFASPCFNQTP